jgi:hypothetical protein
MVLSFAHAATPISIYKYEPACTRYDYSFPRLGGKAGMRARGGKMLAPSPTLPRAQNAQGSEQICLIMARN